MPTDNREVPYAALNLSRRSWIDFTGKIVEQSLLIAISKEAALAPSSSNLQPWHFVFFQGKGLSKLNGALSDRNYARVMSSGTAAVVLGNPSEVNKLTGSTIYDSGKASRRDFAIRNASLVAMNFMLSAWSYGIATRPMIGFEPYLVREAAGAPRHLVPVISMAVGYPAESSELSLRSRKPIEEIVSFVES